MNEIMVKEKESFDLQPSNFAEALQFAEFISKSSMVPKDYKDKPADVLIAIQMGKELGLKPLQALQNIATINGRPCVWGDAMLALVQSHKDCEYINEYMENENTDNETAYCIVKRRNQPEAHPQKFSISDAKKAGLWNKVGPWTHYPKRMLKMRARGFALRDTFADVLRGIITREEAEDYSALKMIHDDSKAESIKKLLKNKETPQLSELPMIESEKIPQIENLIKSAQTIDELTSVWKTIKKDLPIDLQQQQIIRDSFKIRADELKQLSQTDAAAPPLLSPSKTDLDKSWEDFKNEK